MSTPHAVAVPALVDRAPLCRVLGRIGAGAGVLFAAMTAWEHAAGLGTVRTGAAATLNQGLFGVAMAGFVALAAGLHLARPGGAAGWRASSRWRWPSRGRPCWPPRCVDAVAGLDPDTGVLAPVGGLLQAVALLGLGITTAVARRWSGWRRWTPLALAVFYVGALMVPAFSGPIPACGRSARGPSATPCWAAPWPWRRVAPRRDHAVGLGGGLSCPPPSRLPGVVGPDSPRPRA